MEIWFFLEKDISNLPQKYYEEFEIEYKGKHEFNKVKFYKTIIENGDKIIDEFATDDFVVRKIRWLKESLNKNKLLFEKMKNIEQQVKNDIRRLYRLRNLLVHQAYVGEMELSYLTKRMIFYLRVILNNISYALDKNPSHTLLELLISKRKSYDLLLNSLEISNYPDIDIDTIIYPITVLSN